MSSKNLRSKVDNAIDSAFREKLKAAVSSKFGIEIETHYDVFAMRLVSRRVDGKDFSNSELDYVEAFESGYIAAWNAASAALEVKP